jgi:hypothetical protein
MQLSSGREKVLKNAFLLPPEEEPGSLFQDEITGHTVPKAFGLNTILERQYLTGGAAIDLFLGNWEELPHPTKMSNAPICPRFAGDGPAKRKYICDYTLPHRANETCKEYTTTGLNQQQLLNGKPWTKVLQEEIGPVVFVGDSLSQQQHHSMMCLLEYQNVIYDETQPPSRWIKTLLGAELAVPDMVHVRIDTPNEEYAQQQFFGAWKEQVLASNASYVVYNTGAWWNPHFVRWKLEWCDYQHWPELSLEELTDFYELTLRRSLLPMLQELWHVHGIRTVWRDLSPGGGLIQSDFPYHTLFPLFNDIGRDVVSEAGGYILPIWYVSLLRQEDHIREDSLSSVKDYVHWCSYHSPNTVPAVWNHLLFHVLQNNHVRTSSAPEKKVQRHPNKLSSQRNQERIVFLTSRLEQSYLQHQTVVSGGANKTCSCRDAISYVQCTANRRCTWKSVACNDLRV